MRKEFDYIVVGGGTSGCVVASRLSADTSSKVALLEAGGSDNSLAVLIPALLPRAWIAYNWNYPTEPDASREGKVDFCAAGKVLGGGSSISAMLFCRGNAADYDAWSANGCQGWGYSDVLPYFKMIECYEGGESRFRGSGGALQCSKVAMEHPLTSAFIKASQEAGFYFNEDYNGETQLGVSYLQMSQKRGRRHSTAAAFLHPARSHKNLVVFEKALALRILFERKRACGVAYEKEGREDVLVCRKEVVLCAGAYASPKILLQSGIGPEREIERVGIKVLVNSPYVGRNLMEHPHLTATWRSRRPTINARRGIFRKAADLIEYLVLGRGPISSPVGHAQVFLSCHERQPRPHQQLVFTPLSYSAEVDESTGRVVAWHLASEPAVNVLICALRPESRGTISLRSGDPHDPPLIRHELLGGGTEVRDLITGLQNARMIMRQSAISWCLGEEIVPGEHVTEQSDLHEFVRANAWRGNHPVGSCRMGIGEDAVVDPYLRVRGVEGVRVADASIMPSIISGNTSVPCTMIGAKAASLISSGMPSAG